MADTEIKNGQDVDNQNQENDIKEILNSYDINIKNEEDSDKNKKKESKINSKWTLTKGVLEVEEQKVKAIIDVDKYWNFNGYINPKIDVEFYIGVEENGQKKGKWVNINTISNKSGSFKTNNSNNYIVSANITDYGPKELELILYDRNFTDLQRLISSSISFVDDELNKNDSEDIDFKGDVEEGSKIEFLTSPAKITTNIRLRYGYNEDRSTKVYKKNNYSGVNEGYYAEIEKEETDRWNSVTTSAEMNEETNQSLRTDKVLTSQYQQATLFSNWQYFVIVGIGSNLTNTGIKYTIKGISTEEFALNGYKMYQQYSVIKGKPKTVMSTLMNMFNSKENSPIKLIWADETIKANEAPINGEDLLIDYESGDYKIVTEENVEELKEELVKPLKDIKEYIKMLIDIKACFTYIDNNELKSYVDGKNVEYNSNIDLVTNYEFNNLTKPAPKHQFIDFAMWPLYGDLQNIDYKLNAEGYGTNLLRMAIYQKEVSDNLEFIKDKKGLDVSDNKEKGHIDKASVVNIKNLMRIWLANIAIEAYDLKNKNPPTTISEIRIADIEARNKIKNISDLFYKIDGILYRGENSLNGTDLKVRWYTELCYGYEQYYPEQLLPEYFEKGSNIFLPDLNQLSHNGSNFSAELLNSEDEIEILNNNIFEMYMSDTKIAEDNIERYDRYSNGYYDKKENYPLKLLKKCCCHKVINDIEFFTDEFNMFDTFFNKSGYSNGTVLNVDSINKFFKSNSLVKDDSMRSRSKLGVATKIVKIGKDGNYIGIENDQKTIESLINLSKKFDIFFEFIVKQIESKEYSFPNSISFLKKDEINPDVSDLTNIFNKEGEKYSLNGFTLDDICYENVEVIKLPQTNGIYYSFRINVSKDKYFFIKIDDPVSFWESGFALEYVKSYFALYIKQVVSFGMEILNKQGTITMYSLEEAKKGSDKEEIPTKIIDEKIKIFEDYLFGKLSVPTKTKDYSDINKEYYNYIIKVKAAMEKAFNETKYYDEESGTSKTLEELFNEKESLESANNEEKAKFKKSKIKDILEEFLEEIKDINYDIAKLKIGPGENDEEVFGTFNDEINLLELAFKTVGELNFGQNNTKSNDLAISNLTTKIDKKLSDLNEVLDHLENRNKNVSNSNIGKEIELSLGSQESKSRNGKALTKTISSLLNDFCSQCLPRISKKEKMLKEIIKSDSGDSNIKNKITIKDENGDDKVVELYQNIPRYNLTWGVVGSYSSVDSNGATVERPVIGFYYKEPRKISKLRRYNWGTGNNKQHCIKSLNISTGSEFALLHAYNTVTDTSDGQIITAIDNNKQIVRKVDNILPTKSPCFFNNSFDNDRDKNTFNNMINSLSKGTITVLGDPTLRFSGNVQPYTFPIYININLAREMSSWSSESNKYQDNTEFSQLSGYYVLTKISHSISSSGYLTTLEIMKYPGTGDSFIGYISK